MSVDIYVFLERKNLPSRERLNKAFDEHGIDLSVPKEDGWGTDSVCVERDGKVDDWAVMSFHPIDNYFREMVDELELGKAATGLNLAAEFSFRRHEELAIAMPTAMVLAMTSSGFFYDPQEGECFTGRALLKHFKEMKSSKWGDPLG